jgi:hypothetical protein
MFNVTDKERQEQEQIREHGRLIARGIEDVKVEKRKNTAMMAKRYNTRLEREAEKALSGGVNYPVR